MLIIDHSPILLEGIAVLVQSQPDMMLIGKAQSAAPAVASYISARPDITVIDLDLPGPTVTSIVRQILRADARAKLIGLRTSELDRPRPQGVRSQP